MAKKIKKGKEVDFVRISAIVGIVFVILVASMFVSVSITGNVIRQNNYRYGRYTVYTKEEVDRLISSVSARSGSSVDVYEQIRDLVPIDGRKHLINGSGIASCENTCKSEFGTKCVLALVYSEQKTDLNESYTHLNESYTLIRHFGCTDITSAVMSKLSCLCEPPAKLAGSSGWN
jgi:hypothetical protein